MEYCQGHWLARLEALQCRGMAALAPLSAVTAGLGSAAPVPGTPIGTHGGGAGSPAPASTEPFTAFPSSYSEFGNDQVGYGQVGVKNGAIAVVAADPGSTAPTGTDSAASTTAAGAAGNPPGGAGAAPADPPSGAFPAPPGDPPPGAPPLPPIPVATLPPQPQPQTPGLNAPSLPGPFPANPPGPAPGPFAAEQENQNQGPSELQQQQAAQEQAAQQAQAQQANQQEAQNQQETIALQNVSFRLSDAYANGDQSAVQQLAPIAAKINGALQGQIWAGLGTTPPQPFATPEIPSVFLNIPS